jgi:hypothetical protein
MDRVTGIAAQFSTANDLHSINTDSGIIHLLQDGCDLLGWSIHMFACIIDPGEYDIYPRRLCSHFKRSEIVTGHTVGPNHPRFLFLFKNFHDPRVRIRPVLVCQTMHQQDIDIICFELLQKSGHIVFRFPCSFCTGFRGNDHGLSSHIPDRVSNVRVASVLICSVPKRYSATVAVTQQIGQSFQPEVCLVGASVPTVCAGAETESGDFNSSAAKVCRFHFFSPEGAVLFGLDAQGPL